MNLTILFTEDEDSIRSVMATLLELFGYRVIQAKNGAEGLDLLKGTKVALVITDINMPVMDGNEFISHLSALPDPPPVIALSGDASEVYPNPVIREIVSKPVSIHTLKKVMQRVLAP